MVGRKGEERIEINSKFEIDRMKKLNTIKLKFDLYTRTILINYLINCNRLTNL